MRWKSTEFGLVCSLASYPEVDFMTTFPRIIASGEKRQDMGHGDCAPLCEGYGKKYNIDTCTDALLNALHTLSNRSCPNRYVYKS